MVVPPTVASPGTKAEVVSVKRQRHRPESSALLDLWLKENNNNLYPSKDEKEQLVKETQLSYSQVSRWFSNRRRKLKLRNCPSPTCSTPGFDGNSSSPSGTTIELPGTVHHQAQNCPGNATLWNDGSLNTGGINLTGVIQTASMLPGEEEMRSTDSNNNRDSEILKNSGHMTAVTQTNERLFTTGANNDCAGRAILELQSHLPTAPALIPGVYPPFLPGKNLLPSSFLGLPSGFDLTAAAAAGVFNPYILSAALASGSIFSPGSNLWVQDGVFPLFPNPLLSPPETVASEKQKEIEEDQLGVIPERELVNENGNLPHHYDETKDEETERLLMELSEKESIAVSVLTEFALQKKQRLDEISVIV